MARPKLAVVGASHFQVPLIQTAQRMGCEVHAFAWECGDPGEDLADYFHPISIVETSKIVEECRRIGVDGICTIASDLATVAVCTVAYELGLPGNSLDCMRVSTNKRLMREAFARGGDPSPKSRVVQGSNDASDLDYPLIVKPADRSGSRGITKLEAPDVPISLDEAIRNALEQSFCKEALVEEFARGDEFSVEGISWQGNHNILAITRKFTTGAPHFIETAHIQPAGLAPDVARRVEEVTVHALNTLGVTVGASHTELKIDGEGNIRIIEIGARMGGDCIGSHLVELSTGIDYVRAVVDVALGNEPDLVPAHTPLAAASRFLFTPEDVAWFKKLRDEKPELIRYSMLEQAEGAREVTDSSTRLGHFVMAASDYRELLPYLPQKSGEGR